MMIPLNIRFDSAPNVQGSNVVHVPKLNQGAPYLFSLRIRNEDGSYRDFGSVPEVRMRIKLRPSDTQDLMVLTKTTGNFIFSTETSANDTFTWAINTLDWATVTLPRSSNYMETDVPFTFVIEFLDIGGVVTERFAQGSGFISVNLLG